MFSVRTGTGYRDSVNRRQIDGDADTPYSPHMDARVLEEPTVIETVSCPVEDLPSEGRPLRGVVFGTILSAALWAGLILTGAALIR